MYEYLYNNPLVITLSFFCFCIELLHLQTDRRQMGLSHLATFCPICRRDVSRWDVPSANILPYLPTFFQSADGRSAVGTIPSGYILTTLPKFCPICILDKMLPDGPSRLPSEHNVGRWAVPSADRPGPSGYISPNLQMGRQQMGRPICQHFAQSADILSNLHTGRNVPR